MKNQNTLSEKLNVLITGAGSGLGRLTTESLLKAGHSVTGSMRDIKGRNKQAADELIKLGAFVVEIDVTSDESTQNGVDEATGKMGSVDVIINNAGLGALGINESFTSGDWMKIFDINVFGVQRMIRAVAPQMKERGKGLIITISSLTARIALPFQGPYGPSKWAAEALTELYRLELSNLGVETCIIEPGGLPTKFLDNLSQPSDPSRIASYGELGKMPANLLGSFEQTFAANPAQNPQLVADAVENLIGLEHGERPFRTVVDKMGLGDLVIPHNAHSEKVNTEMYAMFGLSDLVKVKK